MRVDRGGFARTACRRLRWDGLFGHGRSGKSRIRAGAEALRHLTGWILSVLLTGLFVAPASADAQQEQAVRRAALAAVEHALENRSFEGDHVITTPDRALTDWLTRETDAVPVPDGLRFSCEDVDYRTPCIRQGEEPVVEIRDYTLEETDGTVRVQVEHFDPEAEQESDIPGWGWKLAEWKLRVRSDGERWLVEDVVWMRVGN